MSEKKSLFPVLLVMAPILILGIAFPLPAKSQGDAMCRQLLANTVIENYEIEIEA
mgnify:CR=1 FL=1